MKRRFRAGGAAALLALAAVPGCGREATPEETSAPIWAGSEACARCHAAEYARWQGSQHARAMQPVGAAGVHAAFDDVAFLHAGVTNRFRTRGGRFFVETDGPDGRPVEVEVTFAFGVAPLQQFVVPFSRGRLQALPFAWDTRSAEQGGQRWFHVYGSEPTGFRDELHWTRPAQNWNHQCADCHATGLRKRYDAGADAFDTRWAELGVGCEGCHGPASAHAAAKEEDPRASAPLPARLDERRGVTWARDAATGQPRRSAPRAGEREIEVCAQCHARRTQLTDAYAPGERFLDHYLPALLETGLYHPDGQQLAEVYDWGSFLQSKMAANGVTCADCHEPHAGKLRADGNALCTSCHDAARYDAPAHHHHAPASPGAQCVACHMPAATYMQIDPRHDHSLRVPRPDLSERLGVPSACGACHAAKDAAWAAGQVRAWLGRDASGHQRFAEAFAGARDERPAASARLRDVAADAGQPAIARASALAALAQWPGPLAASALASGARDPQPLVRLGALRGAAPLPPQMRAELAGALLGSELRALRVEAASLVADAEPLLAPDEREAFARAARDFEEAQRFAADRAEARVALADFLARRGDAAGAERELRAALAQEPAWVPAHANLADLQRSRGAEDEAERTLREGLALAPDAAALHHALGLALVRRGAKDEGVASLARAHALAPVDARFAYVYAVGLHGTGHEREAVALLARTHEAHPGDRDVLAALASYERDPARARVWRERLQALDAAR